MCLQSAGFIYDKDGTKHRFGFEFMSGLSGKPSLSNANKNAFTIDGKLYKLPSMDMLEGFDNRQTTPIEKVHIKSRELHKNSEIDADCDIWFAMKFKMEADVNAVIVKVHEMYE